MRLRDRTSVLAVVSLSIAVFASGCGSSAAEPPSVVPPAADRSDDERADWDVEQTILRTGIIESALESGLDRDQAGCVIDSTLGAGDFDLADLEEIDVTASVSSDADTDLASALADSLLTCGPSPQAYLNTDVPGSSSIPDSHSVQRDCLTNAYLEAWRDAYADRFSGATNVPEADDARIPEIADALSGIIDGCDAGGAVILGASNEGHLETGALTTLEWECLEARVDPDAFMPAFPFPDEPGDALERMGDDVNRDVSYCRTWIENNGLEIDIDEANR